jgi:hypothetical protein
VDVERAARSCTVSNSSLHPSVIAVLYDGAMKNRSAFSRAMARRDLMARVLAIAIYVCCASAAKAQVTTLLDLENTPGQGYTLHTFSIPAQLAQSFLAFEFRQDSVSAGYDSGALLQRQVAAVRAGTAMTIMATEVGRTLAEFSVDGTARLGTQTYIYAGLMGEARSC